MDGSVDQRSRDRDRHGGDRWWLYEVRIGLDRPPTASEAALLARDTATGPYRCEWIPAEADPLGGRVLVHGPAGDAAPAVHAAVGWVTGMLHRDARPRYIAVWPAMWAPRNGRRR